MDLCQCKGDVHTWVEKVKGEEGEGSSRLEKCDFIPDSDAVHVQ